MSMSIHTISTKYVELILLTDAETSTVDRETLGEIRFHSLDSTVQLPRVVCILHGRPGGSSHRVVPYHEREQFLME